MSAGERFGPKGCKVPAIGGRVADSTTGVYNRHAVSRV